MPPVNVSRVIGVVESVPDGEYATVAASQTTQVLGAGGGAAGDILIGVLVIPASTSPGAVQVKDGGNTAVTIFAGGATSVVDLRPFWIPLGILSTNGKWQVTTGASVSAVAVGKFT